MVGSERGTRSSMGGGQTLSELPATNYGKCYGAY